MLTADEAGFDEFVATRGAAFQRAAYLLTGDHHAAQDLVQQALMEAARRWERIHTSPEAYVRRSIYTANVTRWRRTRFTEQQLGEEHRPARGAAATTYDADDRLSIVRALDQLTAKQRAVLALRHYEDLAERQTAEAGGTEIQADVTGPRTLDLTAPDSRFVLHPWSTPGDGDRVDVLGLDREGLPRRAVGRPQRLGRRHDGPEDPAGRR